MFDKVRLTSLTGPRAAICFVASLTATGNATPAWQTNEFGRWTSLPSVEDLRNGFSLVSPEATGVTVTNLLPADRSLTNHILLNGSGVALGDVDGDGRCDLFFPALGGRSALFRNLGDWKFSDITAAAFSPAARATSKLTDLDATGAVFADINGDGSLDLLINAVGRGTRCFQNDGSGRFRDVTEQAGLGGISGATSLALADIDNDGDLDLYVVNYRSSTIRDQLQMRLEVKNLNGHPEVASFNGQPANSPELIGRFTVDASGQITEHGEADQLFLNDGHGHFTLAPFTSDTFRDANSKPFKAPLYDWGLAAMFRDVNGDGAPDLYVCNDLNSPDRLWLNDGRGHFRAASRHELHKTSWFSMGVDFGDLNRDGYDDFLVTDMLSRDPVRRQVQVAQRVASTEAEDSALPQTARNTLFAGRGDGTFTEIAQFAGLAASDWSWSPVFLDVDLDGYEDVLITTGFERDVQDADVADEIEEIRRKNNLSQAAALQLRKRFPRLALPNLAFHNRGGWRFEETGKDWGFNQVGISQGIALADLDGDGDLDVVVNNLNSPPLLLRNNATAARVAVRLKGRGGNTQGIGARVEVTGGPVFQSQEFLAGGRYLSGDEALRVFACGSAHQLTLTVRWRNGLRTVITNAAPNTSWEIFEPAPSTDRPAGRETADPLFRDESDQLLHRHFEEPFDDSLAQPLLPRRLSGLGPAVVWSDLDGDGREDLVIGAGRGGTTGVFMNQGQGAFKPSPLPVFASRAGLDQAGLLAEQGSNGMELLAALSSYEVRGAFAGIRAIDVKAGVMRFAVPGGTAAIGPLALADVNADGRPDLFVGGRVIPGRYPQAASSSLYLKQANGSWQADQQNSRILTDIGLVSSARFTDLDGDGRPELVLACEWGPIHLFSTQNGILREQDSKLRWENSADGRPDRLSELKGLWCSVGIADLDNDGRLDVILGNWGLNTKYHADLNHPAKLYYGDFSGTGRLDLLECSTDPESGREIPFETLDVLSSAMPVLRERFPTRQAFAQASVASILGESFAKAQQLSINTLDSLVLLNRGDEFLVRPLPAEAQWAPCFGIVNTDFDGDGREDLFLAQNSFQARPGPSAERDDGGCGLLLRGDGHGGFAVLSPEASGIRVEGEQRAAATADYDADGRPDLVVTQNQDATRLFHNKRGKPGLRVRLSGPPENPQGIGATLRLVYEDGRSGPLREIAAGTGYWSQDSAVPVLGEAEKPAAISLTWPGGAHSTFPIPAGAKEIQISTADQVQVIR